MRTNDSAFNLITVINTIVIFMLVINANTRDTKVRNLEKRIEYLETCLTWNQIDTTCVEMENDAILHRNDAIDKVNQNPVYPGRSIKNKKASKPNKSKFVKYMVRAAKEESKIYTDIPYQLYVAQAILESNYGSSKVSTVANNLYGHKHKYKTKNYIKAYDDKVDDKFTVFNSRWESIRAHSKKLMGMYRQRIVGKPTLDKWIESLCGGNSVNESLDFIENGGSVYATNCYKLSGKNDICYGEKIRRIIEKYNLN